MVSTTFLALFEIITYFKNLFKIFPAIVLDPLLATERLASVDVNWIKYY